MPWAVCALLLGGAAGAADPVADPDRCREIALLFGYLDNDGVRHGRYAGSDSGGFAGIEIDACRGPRPGEGGARRWYVRGSGGGLATRWLQLGGGEQGRYAIHADMRRLATPGAAVWTPLRGEGDTFLLPPDWVPAPGTAGMSRLPELGEARLGLERRQRGLGLAFLLPGNWRIETRYRREARQGWQRFGGVIGSTGGNARAIVVPAPVDHLTRQADTTLGYAGEHLQLRIGHHLSQFDNAATRLRWQNPFVDVAGWAPSASHPGGFGQAQPAPDNRFQQFSLSGAYGRSAALRINADLALGSMRQNQAYLPYTVDPVLAESATQGLPRASLDGRIDTTLLQLRLSGRPHRHWRWSATYRFDDRDNRTPRDAYVGIGGDAQAQNADPASGQRRYNLPYGFRERTVSADAGFRPSRRFDASLGLRRQETARTWSSRADSDETRIELALRGHAGDRISGGVRLREGRRSGSTYVGNRAFLDSHSPDYVDTVAGGFENLPALRQYHLADRDRSHAQLFATFTPTPALGIGIEHGRTRDAYRRSELGLQRSRIDSTGIDVSYAPGGDWAAHAHAGRERFTFDQAGHSFRGGANRLEEAFDPERDWFAFHRDRALSLGLGASRELLQGRLKLRADYSQAWTEGKVAVVAGTALETGPLPPTKARLRRIDLDADYRLQERTRLRLRYSLESFRSRDWAFDGVGPETLSGIILLGGESPDYGAGAVMLSLHRSF
ncbi:MtrB/PioB family decaheme-associated outer membrane protein [Luteimonas sp. SJ-92]|uniref:MtrB/PioB family decaheme-associated outer membrane protein n=1 Tax=Luteimonas salinisoli TaxID=2752307 RepID=A0A853JIB2_9GAMM|nr:MtrB/PioB family decaheme-associated outer membrane protein [Luteimonas salinisoli]NZA28277.1 MtrB/PioB family decaheme-associated outer membrane protein [Luteimonas salinisoli]